MNPIPRIESLVQQVCDDYAFSLLRGHSLQQALIRDISSRLDTVKQRGAITRYVVRCDASTNGGDTSKIAVEVTVLLPTLVQHITIRCVFAQNG